MNAEDTIQCFVPVMGNPAFIFLVVSNIVLAITTTVGNTLLLVALYKESSLRPPSKILICSLMLTDMCAGIVSEPLFVVFLMAVEFGSQHLCSRIMNISIFTSEVLGLLSLFTLTAISVDRLLALSLGMRYKQEVTFKRVTVVVVCVWTLIVSTSAVFWDNMKVILYYFFIYILLCVIVSSCCYISVYQKLRLHQTQVQDNLHQGQPNGHEPLNIARYRKTVSSALWVLSSILVCYLPMTVLVVSMVISGATSSLPVAWAFSRTLVFFNYTLNPILYCWKITEMRRAVIETVGQIHAWCCTPT